MEKHFKRAKKKIQKTLLTLRRALHSNTKLNTLIVGNQQEFRIKYLMPFDTAINVGRLFKQQ